MSTLKSFLTKKGSKDGVSIQGPSYYENCYQPCDMFALKIDVDTERGTRLGVPNLVSLLQELNLPATFFFAFGNDNTGRAIKRVFRSGFIAKVKRTKIISIYGMRTLLNGILLPGPHIGRRHENIMRRVNAAGFSTGIHCYDHVRWQDGVAKMSEAKIACEFAKAHAEYNRIFAMSAKAAAAPGWQANAKTLAVYDKAALFYASDCRGGRPFFPRIGRKTFQTLQIPTTLPTLDELLGFSNFPLARLVDYYSTLLRKDHPNVMTVHAELEGMQYFEWFKEFLLKLKQKGMRFLDLETIATTYLKDRKNVAVCELVAGVIPGRSGTLAIQND